MKKYLIYTSDSLLIKQIRSPIFLILFHVTTTEYCINNCYQTQVVFTSLILFLFSRISGSAGSPLFIPIRFGKGTGGSGLLSFFLSSCTTLFFSVWISAWISSRDFFNFSFASSRAFSWSARILFLRRSSSSLETQMLVSNSLLKNTSVINKLQLQKWSHIPSWFTWNNSSDSDKFLHYFCNEPQKISSTHYIALWENSFLNYTFAHLLKNLESEKAYILYFSYRMCA